MESLLIGSFQRPSSLLSFPTTVDFCSRPCGSQVAANVLKSKAFSNTGKLYAIPLRLQLRRQNLLQLPARSIDESIVILNPKRGSRHIAKSASERPLDSESSKSPWRPVLQACDAFYRFSRPHTVIGTALSIVSVSLLAVEKFSDFSPLFFSGVLEAIAAALLMNIYIVGLNQLSDIEIDKVNKPYLPLASGEYSVRTGVMIVSSFAILESSERFSLMMPFIAHIVVFSCMCLSICYLLDAIAKLKSFWLGYIVGSWPLFWALFVSFVLGTAYSINLPLLRWKRFAVVAAMCILAVRAVIVQIAFYLHVQMYVFGRPAVFSKPVIFATAFMSFFSVVIALFKDIPDIVGDKIYGIQSFTVRLGQERVFWICISLLEMAYGVALLVGAMSSCIWSKWTTVIGHALLGLLLWSRAKSINLKSKTAITSFYMFIWKLFYAEYLLIPLVR